MDFNYFGKDKINIKLNNPNNNLFVNQMGWDILPEGMYLILKRIKKYNLPILITENGTCLENKDVNVKTKYLESTLKCISLAINEGIDVIGYNYWTYIDNFEWEFGYNPKFGLYDDKYQLNSTGIRFKEIISLLKS